MSTTTRTARRPRRLVTLLGIPLTLLLPAIPATAAYLDTDGVNAMTTTGDGVTGTVYWTNTYVGSARLTVRNNVNDRYCVLVQDRLQRGGVWSRWTERGPYCFNATYSLNLMTGNNGRPIQSWQFRTRPAWASNWLYDTNAPGGA